MVRYKLRKRWGATLFYNLKLFSTTQRSLVNGIQLDAIIRTSCVTESCIPCFWVQSYCIKHHRVSFSM